MPAAKAVLYQIGAAMEAWTLAAASFVRWRSSAWASRRTSGCGDMEDGSRADYGRLSGLIFSLAFVLHEHHAAIVALGLQNWVGETDVLQNWVSRRSGGVLTQHWLRAWQGPRKKLDALRSLAPCD